MTTTTTNRPWGHLEPVGFGEALKRAVRDAHVGGMPGIERTVLEIFGPTLGRRSALNELYTLKDAPTDADDNASVRAWVVLTLIREDPVVWGVPDNVLPPVWGSPESVREVLTSRYAVLAA